MNIQNTNTITPTQSQTRPLIFGIYPGGQASLPETDVTIGPADDPAHIHAALAQLQAPGRPFIVRAYMGYVGGGQTSFFTPADVEQYISAGRKLDLVLCYRAPAYDVADWCRYIRTTIQRYEPYLGMLQIAEEPNSTGPGGNGGFPHVRQAVVDGVLAAKEEAVRCGADFQVGFNATPSFNPQDDFWHTLGQLGQAPFVAAPDYVGLDFFPDVFRPIAPDGLQDAVSMVLTRYRQVNLADAHIPAAVPIHIGENGWPTSPTRSAERQATVLETIVRAVAGLRGELNITHYTYFDLRDADSAHPDFGYQFGLMRDDYAPKPAFERYRKLIAE
ncbi:MAG: hypothetical protein M1546_08435 [Chloroflexi bacterium]|nr:hypothetical protein [Chloroflexota bacterium]